MSLTDALKSINNNPNNTLTPTNQLTTVGVNEQYIKGFIITLLNDGGSTIGARKCIQSIKETGSKIIPFIIDASTPVTMRQDLAYVYNQDVAKKIQYTWPTNHQHDGTDLKTGLYRRTYDAADWKRVMACSVSHMKLWKTCVEINEPIMILEHDALFVKTFKFRYLKDNGFKNNICGINSPLGATRKARVFNHKALSYKAAGCHPCPSVDDIGDVPLPQGIAGNSAYVITPFCAQKLLDKTLEVGIWPNDAVMCKQFFPWLQICIPFYTNLQGIKSTTTG